MSGYVGMFVCMYVCMYICLSVCLSVCLYVCMSVYVCKYVCLSLCLSVNMSACLYVCLSVCMYVCLSVCLSVCLFGRVTPKILLRLNRFLFTRSITHVTRSSSKMIQIRIRIWPQGFFTTDRTQYVIRVRHDVKRAL